MSPSYSITTFSAFMTAYYVEKSSVLLRLAVRVINHVWFYS